MITTSQHHHAKPYIMQHSSNIHRVPSQAPAQTSGQAKANRLPFQQAGRLGTTRCRNLHAVTQTSSATPPNVSISKFKLHSISAAQRLFSSPAEAGAPAAVCQCVWHILLNRFRSLGHDATPDDRTQQVLFKSLAAPSDIVSPQVKYCPGPTPLPGTDHQHIPLCSSVTSKPFLNKHFSYTAGLGMANDMSIQTHQTTGQYKHTGSQRRAVVCSPTLPKASCSG